MRPTVALALVAGLGLALWFVLERASGGRGGEESGAPREATTEPAPAHAPELRVPAAVDVEPEEGAVPASAGRREALRADDVRLAGTVLAPGLPAGEDVIVQVALYAERGGPPLEVLSTLAARDGSFLLALRDDARLARLDVESRFLCLDASVEAVPGEVGIVLRPEIYAVVEGVVVPPRSRSSLGATWAAMEVELELERSPADRKRASDPSFMSALAGGEKAVIPAGGTFALRLVPPGLTFELKVANPYGPAWRQSLAPLAPGELRTIVVNLESGRRISGRVIDEDGRAVSDAFVWADDGTRTGPRPDEPASDTTSSSGRFELRAPSSVTRVSARGKELAQGAEVSVAPAVGDVRDLVLAVERGVSIEGTAIWPDGQPVEIGKVRAGYREAQIRWGRFRLVGLRAGAHELEAHATRARSVGTARAYDVVPGGPPLELVLEEE